MTYLYNSNNQPVTGDLSTATVVQTATGAVARSLRSHFGDVIWAADFGVQANGSSDDTAAWTNAFNAAVGTQKYIVIAPVGVSVISTITIPVGVTLRGATPTNSYPFGTLSTLLGSVLKKTSGSSSAVATSTSGTGNDNRGTAMVDMAIIGDSTHHGVTLALGIPFYFRDCVFTQCNAGIEGNTFASGGFPTAVIEGCVFAANTLGVWNVGDSRIQNCFINGNSSHGIQLDSGAQDNIITHNKIEFNGGNGVVADSTEDNVISNNIIDSNGASNIRWTNNRNGVICGNTIRNFADQVTMSGNHLFLSGNTDTAVIGNSTKFGATTGTTPVNAVGGGANTSVIMFGNSWRGHSGSTAINASVTGLNPSLTAVASSNLV